MARPQQPELHRSGTTAGLDPDSIGSELDATRPFSTRGLPGAKVPPENQPGHHPEHEQDQPYVPAEHTDAGDDPARSESSSGRRAWILTLVALVLGSIAIAVALGWRRRHRHRSLTERLGAQLPESVSEIWEQVDVPSLPSLAGDDSVAEHIRDAGRRVRERVPIP